MLRYKLSEIETAWRRSESEGQESKMSYAFLAIEFGFYALGLTMLGAQFASLFSLFG